MIDLQKYIFDKIVQAINNIDKKTIEDIYVLSFYISNVEDDPRKPMITFGYNTCEQYKKTFLKINEVKESKWNYAYWLQNKELVIGDNYGENIADNEIITTWIKEKNLYYTDEMEAEDFDTAMFLGEQIIQEFIDVCINVVKKLHSQDIIRNCFGVDIPILIHELEYYDQIASQNIQANPRELVKEFAAWCVGE